MNLWLKRYSQLAPMHHTQEGGEGQKAVVAGQKDKVHTRFANNKTCTRHEDGPQDKKQPYVLN